MKKKSLHEAFVEELKLKIPKRTDLADYVAQALCVEKETAYRRLRSAIHFTFEEVCVLSKELNISLDNLIMERESIAHRKLLMGLPARNLINVYDESQIGSIINHLKLLTEEEGSEYGAAISEIPLPLYLNYSLLSRFFLLKYKHHSEDRETSIPFSEIKESDALIDFRGEVDLLFKKMNYSYYIWDKKIIDVLVSDIVVAYSLRLLSKQDVADLREEIHRFLTDLEAIAKKGYFEKTGNKFEFYISDTHIDMNYTYLCSNSQTFSTLSTFIIFFSTSSDKYMYERVNTWVKSAKRYSTLLTGICERQRIEFFEQQHAIVDDGLAVF